jgi:thioredoxin-related protein
MLHAYRLAAVILAIGCPTTAVAQGIKFGDDFDASLEKAKKDNKLVLVHFTQAKSPACMKMIMNVFSQPQIAEFAGKKFVAVKVSASELKGAKVFQQFSVSITPTILILDPQGQELSHEEYMEAAAFSKFLETAVEMQTALAALAKVKKENPGALAAGLKKISAFEGVRVKKVLREHAENEEMSDAVRRVALEGFSRQKNALGDLVPFLGQKSPALRTTAFNALKEAGEGALPALLDGLDGYSPEQRANCFILASSLTTKSAKIAHDANFWRTGSAEDREKALKGWKEWWEKNKGK